MRCKLLVGAATVLSLTALAACDDQATSTLSDTESHVVTAETHPANTHDAADGAKDNTATTAKSELR